MTLDKCVQRLRRRIATEDEEAQERAYQKHLLQQQQTAGTTTQGPRVKGKKGKLDRTPSFYTERYTQRSIVNLSGLSVSDPLPVLSQVHIFSTHLPMTSPSLIPTNTIHHSLFILDPSSTPLSSPTLTPSIHLSIPSRSPIYRSNTRVPIVCDEVSAAVVLAPITA